MYNIDVNYVLQRSLYLNMQSRSIGSMIVERVPARSTGGAPCDTFCDCRGRFVAKAHSRLEEDGDLFNAQGTMDMDDCEDAGQQGNDHLGDNDHSITSD